MTGILFVFLLSFGAALLAGARWCRRRFAGRPLASALAAAPLSAAGLGMLTYVVVWLLSRAEGLSAFLFHVALALGLLSLVGRTLRIFPHRPLVYLALARFRKRPALSQFPPTLQRDMKAFFGAYKKACTEADALLFRAGDATAIDEACKRATVGKLLPDNLYVHRSALDALEAFL